MIVGIGNDIIEIERVEKAYSREAFVKKVYTTEEQVLIGKNIARAAGNFAVKEAVSKVLGTGFRGIRPSEIEVLRRPSGQPFVNLYGRAEAVMQHLGIDRILVSISDTKDYVCAVAVGERNAE